MNTEVSPTAARPECWEKPGRVAFTPDCLLNINKTRRVFTALIVDAVITVAETRRADSRINYETFCVENSHKGNWNKHWKDN